jgi:hypothetical protein
MKNDIKMVAYAERDSHGSRGDKTLTHDEGRRTQGGWRSNCLSRPGGIRDGKRGMCTPFGRDGCCGLYLLSRMYWLRRLCFAVSREPLDGCVLL